MALTRLDWLLKIKKGNVTNTEARKQKKKKKLIFDFTDYKILRQCLRLKKGREPRLVLLLKREKENIKQKVGVFDSRRKKEHFKFDVFYFPWLLVHLYYSIFEVAALR